MLSAKGFSETRLADIADEANVPVSAIYYYYESREALIGSVMAAGALAVLDHLDTCLAKLPAGSTSLERLDAAVEAHLRLELGISDYSRAIIRNANQLPETISKDVIVLLRRYHERWRTILSDLDKSNVFRAGIDVSISRMLVLGALNWAVEWFDPKVGSVDNLVKEAQRLIRFALTTD